jgi:hypothetical protein
MGNLTAQTVAYLWPNGANAFQPLAVAGGSFDQTIDPAGGPNTEMIIAGTPAYSGLLSNTLPNAGVYILKFTGPALSVFRSTLRWNQANTDVDQYVTEPTGATSWYSSHNTAGGLTLDFDNTSGFGPENTTLAANLTPIPGNYSVQTHYYSDHGTGQSTSGTVTITLYERDPVKQKMQTKFWQLSTSGAQIGTCCNQQPGSTGPDWVNIALVNIVNDVIALQ